MIVKRRNKDGGEIPTSSMADIAFLLLVFFLVTTTINQDKGLDMVLPEWGNEMDVPKKNILNILINPSGEVMLGGNPTQTAFIKEEVEKRILANENLVVSLKTSKFTEWRKFIEVLDQVKLSGAKKISMVDPDK